MHKTGSVKIEHFAKIIYGLLTISAKPSILDVWRGSEYSSEWHYQIINKQTIFVKDLFGNY